jgi:succinate dehydrogenase/fumarate reductase flavoprotein subunit
MDRGKPDFIVIGSGAAGMTAALTGSLLGLSVVIVEKAGVVGGTTSISAGSVWIPNTFHSPEGADNVEQAQTYLKNTVGNRIRPTLHDAFLKNGPDMIQLLSRTDVKFRPYPKHPDYLSEENGATLYGRALEPLPFNAKFLGRDFRLIKDPLPEFTILGGMMVNREDISYLLNASHSLKSMSKSLGLVARYMNDRLNYHRGTRLVMGNALVGRLFSSLRKRGVIVRIKTNVTELLTEDKHVVGVKIESRGQPEIIRSTYGVILATGGFSRHAKLRKSLLPAPIAEHSPLPETITGDGVEMGQGAGGILGHGHAENCFWTPVSIRPRKDGSTAVFPHFVMDRGKPGLIAVNQNAQRFVSEAVDYHLFAKAMYNSGSVPCYFICDAPFIRKYGLGMVYPKATNLRKAVIDRYIEKSNTIENLAQKLDLDPAALSIQIQKHNRYAETGKDKDFQKGENPYEQNLGDPNHKPNPCIGPISTPPFFAIRVFAGDIGASIGLVTDENARVLDSSREPVPGLYACGNDMDSIMAGIYPGPGITIGPAMTFGYIAAKHMLDRKDPSAA